MLTSKVLPLPGGVPRLKVLARSHKKYLATPNLSLDPRQLCLKSLK